MRIPSLMSYNIEFLYDEIVDPVAKSAEAEEMTDFLFQNNQQRDPYHDDQKQIDMEDDDIVYQWSILDLGESNL
ncbi:MAG: hypothetical protein AAF621_03185 [Pseudomonadota bacterium]